MPRVIGDMKLYDVEELSALLDVQERTIRLLLREGKLKGRKLARRWLVSEQAIAEYFSQAETELDDDDEPGPGDSSLAKKESMEMGGAASPVSGDGSDRN